MNFGRFVQSFFPGCSGNAQRCPAQSVPPPLLSSNNLDHRFSPGVANNPYWLPLLDHVALGNNIENVIAKLGFSPRAQGRKRNPRLAEASDFLLFDYSLGLHPASGVRDDLAVNGGVRKKTAKDDNGNSAAGH